MMATYVKPRRWWPWALAGLLVGCTTASVSPVPTHAPLAPPVFRASSSQLDTIAPGVVHHSFVVDSAPWVIHVLDVDRDACWSLEAVKAAGEAVGRGLPSVMLEEFGPTAVAAVNADFFLFTPPGVPTGASIHRGRVVTGPGTRPVLGVTAEGAPWIGVLSAHGIATAGGSSLPISAWNRKSDSALAWFDASWGAVTDTAIGTIRLILGSGKTRPVLSVDSTGRAVTIPSAGGVLVLGASAPDSMRRALLGMAHSRIGVRVALGPFIPREAVGGFPVLVHDSLEVAGLDRAGGANFGPVRHPRTIVGLASDGRRILLVVVDGRQEGYSVGMTLRESAALMLALGAPEAINLDGGGSTVMVYRDRRGGTEIANRPSDKEGERPVANILAVVRGCR